jgi:hypothetical protein
MLNALGEIFQRRPELNPFVIFDVRVLTRGKAAARDRYLDVRRIVFIYVKFPQ